MRICILTEDSKVEQVREGWITKDVLKIPVSSTGQNPATHWFCCLSTTDEGHQKLLALQKNSVIEESAPKIFLSKWKLKIIK